MDTDRVSNRAYVCNLDDKSTAAKMFSSTKAARNAIKGAYVVSVDGKPTFTMADVIGCFRHLQADVSVDNPAWCFKTKVFREFESRMIKSGTHSIFQVERDPFRPLL